MYQSIALLSALLVMYFLSLLLLRDGKKKRSKSTLGSLLDDEEFREDIKKEQGITFYEKNIHDIIDNHQSFFEILYSLLGINIKRIETLLIRAGYDKRSAQEIAYFQFISLLLGVSGALLFLYYDLPIFLSGVSFVLGLISYFFFIQQLKNTYEKNLAKFKYEFPEFLDALRIPIENGMQADIAFRKVSQEWDGFLGQEFQRICLEARHYGDLLYQPLERLAYKINLPVFYNFVSTFNTSMRTGVEMSGFIGKICDDIREMAHMEKMEKNRKKEGPITLIIVFFIFIPVIVLLIGPTIIKAVMMI